MSDQEDVIDSIAIAKRWLPLLDDYPPKRHEGDGPFDQHFGTGIVPLGHARWVLEDIVNGSGDDSLWSAVCNIRRLSFVEGILFSFCIAYERKGPLLRREDLNRMIGAES